MIKLEKAATKIMAAIGTAVMLFLLFYSWKYTKRLVEPEYYLDEKDSILWNALVGIVLVAVCGALSGVMKKIPAWALHLLAVLGAVTAVILGIRLARAAGAESIADQYYVQRAAMALADGDAEWVLAQDYYGIYPFQLGLAEIFALIFRVAGSTERLVIQQVQAVCGGITLYVGFRIVRELSGSRAAELLYLVAELLFLPVYCYALFIYGESIGTCSVPVMLCVLLCGLASMNLMTAPSVSLEGKSLWLMQSLPVEPWQALRAKLRMQVLLTVPPLLLCAVCAAIVYPLGAAGLLVMAVFAASYALLGALAGLTLGVKMPVLTWTDQLMPIKQSAPVMLTLFGGMGYTILLFAGFLLLPGWRLGFAGYAACFAAANLLLCAVLHRWLRKKGAALFAAL